MTSTEGQAHQQTVLDALQQSPAAPFLDMPLPQVPALGSLPQLPAMPQLPPMPPNPLDAILSGQGMPALPGIDQLMKPFTDLASGFGSGSLGGFDPTQIFQQSSGLIDTAMQMGQGGLKLLDQFWQGDAAQNAQTQGTQAQGNGQEISQRGTDISSVTQNAAAAVSRGNAKLTAIAESFATTAIAAAPVLFTPPGQAMLMASATEHLTQAVAVVTETRAELTGHTTQMAGLSDQVPVAAAPSANPAAGGQSPFAMASQVLDSAKPIMSTVTESVGQLVDGVSTHAASADMSDSGLAGMGTPTHSAGLSHGGGFGGGASGGGGGGGAMGGAGLVMGGGAGGGAAAAAPLKTPTLGGGAAAGAGASTSSSTPLPGAGAAATATGAAGMGGGGMMGGMGRGAGAGGGEDIERNSPSYLTDAVNNSDVVGDMPKVVSPVLGADDPEEFIAD